MARVYGKQLILFALLSCVVPLAQAEWELGAYLGASRTQNAALDVGQPARMTHLRFRPFAFEGRSFTAPLYYGYRAAYFWRRPLGLEGEFTHLKVYGRVQQPAQITGVLDGAPVDLRAPVDTIVQRFNITHGVNLVLANVVLRHALGPERDPRRGRFLLTGRAGVGFTVPHPESTILGVSQEHYQAGRLAWQVAGGGEARLWRRLYGIAEYKFSRTRQEVDIPFGSARTLLRSHQGIFGLAYHF